MTDSAIATPVADIKARQLRILSKPSSLGLAAVAGLAFGAYMWAADATVFLGVVPAADTSLIAATTVMERLGIFAQAVVVEEILFRLVIMTGLVWLLAKIAGRARAACYWAAILVVAFEVYPLLHFGYLASLDPTALVVLREIALHGAAGTLWGYLYWRHGWAAAVVGHMAAHASLEPLRALP